MSKYQINEEFKYYSKIKPVISKLVISTADKFLKTPKWLFKDKELNVKTKKIKGYKEQIELIIISRKDLKDNAPCLLYFHGGAFIIDAAEFHYKLASIYAKSVPCKVIFVKYTLATKSPINIPVEDSYCALLWVIKNSNKLNIDINKIALGGDSAGGNIAASLSFIVRDRINNFKLCFNLLIYPFLDRRMNSKSNNKYIDTPMWNSSLTKKLYKLYSFEETDITKIEYISPIEAKSFKNIPPTYIEAAEYDSLHDDSINYYNILKENKIDVYLNDTKGTMHAYDMCLSATPSICNIFKRIEYMKKYFSK